MHIVLYADCGSCKPLCLSFCTPTVGLGCRSGGYTVFIVIATGLVTVEIFLWWYRDARKQELIELHSRATMRPSFTSTGERILMAWARLSTTARSWLRAASAAALSLLLLCLPQPRKALLEERWHDTEPSSDIRLLKRPRIISSSNHRVRQDSLAPLPYACVDLRHRRHLRVYDEHLGARRWICKQVLPPKLLVERQH